MARMEVYLSEKEKEWVKAQGPSWLRKMVQHYMQREKEKQ